MSTQSHQKFMAIWNGLPTIEFKKEWHNGTGYMNGAALEKLQSPVRFVDDLNRKAILVPTSEGSVVLFERYSDGAHDVIVSNSRPVLFDSALSPLAMDLIYKRIEGTLTEEDVQAYIDVTYIKEITNNVMDNFKKSGWID